jgi:hypothetical protein
MRIQFLLFPLILGTASATLHAQAAPQPSSSAEDKKIKEIEDQIALLRAGIPAAATPMPGTPPSFISLNNTAHISGAVMTAEVIEHCANKIYCELQSYFTKTIQGESPNLMINDKGGYQGVDLLIMDVDYDPGQLGSVASFFQKSKFLLNRLDANKTSFDELFRPQKPKPGASETLAVEFAAGLATVNNGMQLANQTLRELSSLLALLRTKTTIVSSDFQGGTALLHASLAQSLLQLQAKPKVYFFSQIGSNIASNDGEVRGLLEKLRQSAVDMTERIRDAEAAQTKLQPDPAKPVPDEDKERHLNLGKYIASSKELAALVAEFEKALFTADKDGNLPYTSLVVSWGKMQFLMEERPDPFAGILLTNSKVSRKSFLLMASVTLARSESITKDNFLTGSKLLAGGGALSSYRLLSSDFEVLRSGQVNHFAGAYEVKMGKGEVPGRVDFPPQQQIKPNNHRHNGR